MVNLMASIVAARGGNALHTPLRNLRAEDLHAARCWGTMVATLADALPAAQGRWPARFADLQDERGPLPGPGTRAAVEATIARVCDGVLPLVR